MELPSSRHGDKHPKGHNLMNELLKGIVSAFADMIESKLVGLNSSTDLNLTDWVEEAIDLSAVENGGIENAAAQDGVMEFSENELELQVDPDEWRNWLVAGATGYTDRQEQQTEDGDAPVNNNNETNVENNQESKDNVQD